MEHRAPLVTDMRALGVSLWQPVPYDELELLVKQLLAEPSRLRTAVAESAESAPVSPEQSEAIDETRDHYRKIYGLG